ncbi:MAG: dihydrodipicolinate synthase family protein [Candidatus Sumerlaeia bacterium]|nr:dihydrodipicolinate synthase family protein [Candidatus Sumerlaeia bacterium]
MTDHRQKLSGVFIPVVTPFRNDDLALDDLRFNLCRLRESKVKGYLALGSNGEFRSLSDREQMQVLEVFAEEKGDKVVMVGTGCESTRQTIEKSKAVAAMGFDYVSVLTPGYFAKRMDGPTLQAHYERAADAVPLPVLIYNAPQFTGGVQMPGSTIVALSGHPNIVGIKDSSPVGPARFLSDLDADADFHVLAGSATFFSPSLHLGARGGILSLANVFPDECADLYRLFIERKYDEAAALHHRLSRLTEAVSGTAGVAGVKAAMEIAGFRGGEPRSPLQPLGDGAREAIRARMMAEGFLR